MNFIYQNWNKCRLIFATILSCIKWRECDKNALAVDMPVLSMCACVFWAASYSKETQHIQLFLKILNQKA